MCFLGSRWEIERVVARMSGGLRVGWGVVRRGIGGGSGLVVLYKEEVREFRILD